MNTINEEEWIAHFSDMYNTENDIVSQNHHLIAQINDNDGASREEMQRVIKTSKNRKAPGLDDIVNEMLKYSGQPLDDQLLKFLNIVTQYQGISVEINTSITVLICRKCDQPKTQNYRGMA